MKSKTLFYILIFTFILVCSTIYILYIKEGVFLATPILERVITLTTRYLTVPLIGIREAMSLAMTHLTVFFIEYTPVSVLLFIKDYMLSIMTYKAVPSLTMPNFNDTLGSLSSTSPSISGTVSITLTALLLRGYRVPRFFSRIIELLMPRFIIYPIRKRIYRFVSLVCVKTLSANTRSKLETYYGILCDAIKVLLCSLRQAGYILSILKSPRACIKLCARPLVIAMFHRLLLNIPLYAYYDHLYKKHGHLNLLCTVAFSMYTKT